MATASFEKSFVVKDKASIKRLEKGLANPSVVKVIERDYKAENARSIEILRRRLSSSKTC